MMAEEFRTVRYKWPDDAAWSQVRVPGDIATVQFSSEKMPIDCPEKLFTITYVVSHTLVGGVCSGGGHVRQATIYAPWGTPETYLDFGAWAARIPQYYANGTFRRYSPLGRHCRSAETRPTITIIDSVIASATDNCSANGCRFKVLGAGNAVIYQEVRQGQCPQWEIEGECPPNTLDCNGCCLDCGQYLSDVRSLVSQIKQLTGSPVIHK